MSVRRLFMLCIKSRRKLYEACDDEVDDTRLELVAACRLCGRLSPPYPHGGAVLNVLRTRSQVRAACSQIEKARRTEVLRDFVVDDTRLELVTSRTSSGCATSCANRPSA